MMNYWPGWQTYFTQNLHVYVFQFQLASLVARCEKVVRFPLAQATNFKELENEPMVNKPSP